MRVTRAVPVPVSVPVPPITAVATGARVALAPFTLSVPLTLKLLFSVSGFVVFEFVRLKNVIAVPLVILCEPAPLKLNVLVVPASALQGATGNYAVLVLDSDGTTRRVPVDVGLVTNATAEIKSGIAEGTNVVTGTTADLVGTATNNNRGFGGVGFPGGGGGTFRQINGGPRNVSGN